MKQKQTERQSPEAKSGLSLEELEAQGVGGLLPNRIEMKRKRKRHGGGSSGQACNGIAGCVGIDVL
jgi:hypothetical protein